MEIAFRKMEAKDKGKVIMLALRTFHSLEGVFIGNPKDAIVACDGEKIVGAATLNIYSYKKGTLGYVDYAFIDPNVQNAGIGKKMYAEVIQELKSRGCNEVAAVVRSDNVQSFHLFEKNGMNRCSLLQGYRILGFGGMVKLLLFTPYWAAACGDFYLTHSDSKRGSISQILWYIWINVAFMMLGIITGKSSIFSYMLAGICTMSLTIAAGGIAGLFTKERWTFRLSTGGGLLSAILGIFQTFFPVVGKWYPEQFNKSKGQKRLLAVSALSEWYMLLLLYVIANIGLKDSAFLSSLSRVAGTLLVYRIIPTYPFNEYGGGRVYRYSKMIYLIQFVITLFLLMWIRS